VARIPDGAQPGSSFVIQVPKSKKKVRIAVPQGAKPGQEIKIRLEVRPKKKKGKTTVV